MGKTILLLIIPLLVILPMTGESFVSEMPKLNELIARADSGEEKAMYDLAYLYDTGYADLPIDSTKSTYYYTLAAEKGYAPAMNYLGYRIYRGEGGVKADTVVALKWLYKAAAQDFPAAWNNLGYILLLTANDSTDYALAAEYLKKAAAKKFPAALDMLGDMYREGLGMQPDTIKASELYADAIRRGVKNSQHKILTLNKDLYDSLPADSTVALGLQFYGHGGDLVAARLFKHAAELGSAHGMALLGDAFSQGRGVAYSHQESLDWYYKAAEAGNASAQFILAELLDMFPDALEELPIRPEPRNDDAQYWYQQARLQEVDNAATAMAKLLEP